MSRTRLRPRATKRLPLAIAVIVGTVAAIAVNRPELGAGAAGGITVQLPAAAGAATLNAHLTTQDVWPGVFAGLPAVDGVTPQQRLNALAPANMRFHAGTDGGQNGVALPFPPSPLGAALPYSDSSSGTTISTAWDFSHLNGLLSEAGSFGGPGQSPLVLNPRYLPDTMYTGSAPFGSPGTFRDWSFHDAATYLADVLAYYNTSGPTPPVAGMTPWPKPAGPWPIKYVEVYNEPDYAWENPRVPPQLSAPSLTLSKASGGSLAAGTYTYRATGLSNVGQPGNGETAAGPAASLTLTAADITAGTRSIRATWTATSNVGLSPSAYVIYGRTATPGMMSVVGSQAAGGLAFTDTGSITPDTSTAAPAADSGSGGGAPLSPLDYRAFWDQVVPAMKAVDPAVKFIGPATTSPGSLVGDSVVRTAGPTQGSGDHSWEDTRNYFQVLEAPSEANKPDVLSFHGYGGWQGSTDTSAGLLAEIDQMATDVKADILPYSGSTPLWQTEANLEAASFTATDGRAVNNFGAAWWGKYFAVMSQVSPNLQNLYDYMLSISNTFDMVFDTTYSGIPGSAAGRPTLPYWAMYYINQLFPPGSRLLSVGGTPAGAHTLAVETPTGKVSVLVSNDGVPAQNLSTTVSLSGATPVAANLRVIDGGTSYATGPALQSLGNVTSVPITFNGNGLALIDFTAHVPPAVPPPNGVALTAPTSNAGAIHAGAPTRSSPASATAAPISKRRLLLLGVGAVAGVTLIAGSVATVVWRRRHRPRRSD